MSKFPLHLLVLTNALLLAFPPSWCCTLRFSSAHVEEKPSCCAHQESKPCDGDKDPSEPQPAVDCCCHVDSSLPPHPEVVAKDLACSPVAMVSLAGLCCVADVGFESLVEIAASPPLQILHCLWLC